MYLSLCFSPPPLHSFSPQHLFLLDSSLFYLFSCLSLKIMFYQSRYFYLSGQIFRLTAVFFVPSTVLYAQQLSNKHLSNKLRKVLKLIICVLLLNVLKYITLFFSLVVSCQIRNCTLLLALFSIKKLDQQGVVRASLIYKILYN